MKFFSIFTVVLICSTGVLASEQAIRYAPGQGGGQPDRDTFYEQPPIWAGINASDGYGSEIADDIPSFLAGQSFDEITLYVGQWLAEWTDPVGLAINIYNNQCPPDLEPDLHYEFPWNELVTELFYHQQGYITIYKVTAHLPAALTITTDMSLGGYALIDWGDVQPYCGFCPTEFDALYGCNEAYWAAPSEGAPRWTLMSVATGYYANLAFGLSLSVSPVREGETAVPSPRLLPNVPNPFNPQTTITFSMGRDERAEISVYDLTGRLVNVLADRAYTTGDHSVVWNGKDGAGRAVPSASYIVRLVTGSRVESQKISLIR